MKKLFLIFLVFNLSCTTYNEEKTSLEGEQILVGKVNWDGFSKAPYSDWFYPNYKDYVVDTVTLSKLNSDFHDIRINLFLGTWCEDSQLQVPQFYKILDYLKHDINQLTVVGLEKIDFEKFESPQHEEVGFAITQVPTFIFFKDGVEIGRITEYPTKTLEKDIVNIINQ